MTAATVSPAYRQALGLRTVRARALADDVTVAMTLPGCIYFEQAGNGALFAPGSIGLTIANRPYAVGSADDYEEIRMIVSRAAFQMHVGEPEALVGRWLRASEPDHPF